MEELAFEGVPLAVSPAEPVPVPVPRPLPAAASDAAAVRTRLAERIQQAHSAVLDAHQAITAWQLAHTSRPRSPRMAPRGVASGAAAPMSECPPADRAVAVLRSAAAAMRAADATPEDHTAITMTWHGEAPDASGSLRTDRCGATWRVSDGDRILAELTLHQAGYPEAWPQHAVHRFPPDPRPLARTSVHALTATDLEVLGKGGFAAVFGSGFRQHGLPSSALPARWPAGLLDEVTVIDPRGGRYARGRLCGTTQLSVPRSPAAEGGEQAWPGLVAAALYALRVYAFHQGFHLCVPGARTVPLPGHPALVEVLHASTRGDTPLELDMSVYEAGLFPQPYLVADCLVTAKGQPVAQLRDLGIALKQTPQTTVPRQRIRVCASGERALADELDAAVASEGPPLSADRVIDRESTAQVRPRLPRGDLRMMDRVARGDVTPGEYRLGSGGVGEYDVPEDPWFLRENRGTVPQLALMEMALQPAGLFSGLAGVASEYRDQDLNCRNLEGRFRLLRQVELPGDTVEQHVVLRSHTPLPGGILHRYGLELHLGGSPFYTGEAVHGFFTPELMAQQQGLDAGKCIPPWLDRRHPTPSEVRRLDLSGDTRLGSGRLALLGEVAIVPAGGEHRAGYLLCSKPVRSADWFFDHHFLHDPVMPGSAGVQMLYQAASAYALHTGLLDHVPDPSFSIAVGEELRWSYRGQVLREHRRVRGEVHIREVRQDGESVRILADGSVWRDDLRIYQVDNIAIDVRAAQQPRLRPAQPSFVRTEDR
ncbi:3-hydroxyacyl-ACP dehydratase [Streptomyces sp. NPDC007205]|uniref:3-hydroxyacyl-ACP dehydratase n=1 Tax=Streptomyces sp. NPDC007205 TaxID=3154316 RepID=UPI0033D447EB